MGEFIHLVFLANLRCLMAIMLGRLEMDIDEYISAYATLSDRIFQKQRHRVKINGQVQESFDGEKKC